MYWYTNIKIIKNRITSLLFGGLVTFIASCSDIDQQEKSQSSLAVYFDIPEFFNQESSKLTQINPLVVKTVTDNKESETKELNISNWNAELSSFLSVDLNTAAYQGHITRDSLSNQVTYTIDKPELDLKKVQIQYKDQQPFKFEIEKTTKNFLYRTDEKLVYIKDSLYRIQKMQKVIFLDTNAYQIAGVIQK